LGRSCGENPSRTIGKDCKTHKIPKGEEGKTPAEVGGLHDEGHETVREEHEMGIDG